MTSDDTTMESLLSRQRQLEAQASADGAALFRARLTAAEQSGAAAHVGGNKKLLSEAVGRVSAGITQWQQSVTHRPGGKHCALKWVSLLGADATAYLTVKSVLDVLALKMPLNDVARSISRYIVDELKFQRFQKQAPGLFEYRMASFSTSNYGHMQRSLLATANYANVDMSDLSMAESTKLLVGTKLLDILIQTTQMVKLQSKRIVKTTHRKKRASAIRQEVVLVPEQDTLDWLTKRNDMLALMQPVNMPMVVPPLPWAPKQLGGYRFALRGRHPLVRGMLPASHAAKIDGADMPLVYEALNALQDTAWAINEDVLSLVTMMKEAGVAMKGVPSFTPEPMPPVPLNIDDSDPEVRRLYRKQKHAVHERNHARVVSTIEFSHTVNVALAMRLDRAIHFPYNLDFRGRIYPICSFLSPQGADLSKALLQFSEGKPLGEHGAKWLAIHGANCLGKTPEGAKIGHWSLDERIDWIDAHTDEICDVATDPIGQTWWRHSSVEKPLQFYAFCCEWKRLTEQGDAFVSHIPVAQDGSCNGLQHFSAMFCDPIGGEAVNLVPGDTPRDIYQRIADTVNARLAEMAFTNPLALLWLNSGLVDRKLAKRPTMTFGYGSKKFGFADQLRDYLRGLDNRQEIKAMFVDVTGGGKPVLHAACELMASLIWDALQSTVVAASMGMEWMQQMADAIIAEGRAVEWTTPSGFPVRQNYVAFEKKQIKTVLAGKLIQPSYQKQLSTIRALKQRNAIAPNVVHSLDATALVLAIHNARMLRGDMTFGMVHDSYATHAADSEALALATRVGFFRLYSAYGVVDSLNNQWKAQAKDNGAECPAPPPMGNLDVSVVLDSPYFFA